MIITNHGGGCCGVLHLYNFPCDHRDTFADRVDRIKKYIQRGIVYNYSPEEEAICDDACGCDDLARERRETIDEGRWKCLVEVLLAEYQLEDWKNPLEAVGFKMVKKFHNSNSGNTCYLYVLETGTGTGEEDA